MTVAQRITDHPEITVADLERSVRFWQEEQTAARRVREMADGPRVGTRFVYVRDPDETAPDFIVSVR